MLMIAGTIRNAVKIAELDNKWQQKKESGSIFQKEMTAQEMQLNQFKEDVQKMRENDNMNAISSKLTSGMELTPEEIEYLQKNAPELYQEYIKSRQEKEAYERQLKNCKTKEEADRLKVNKMSSFLSEAKTITNNPNIPKAKKKELLERILMRTMNVEKSHQKFIASGKYEALPTEEEQAKERKEKAEQTEAAAKELGQADVETKIPTEAAGETAEITKETDKKPIPSGQENVTEEVTKKVADRMYAAEITFSDIRVQIADFMKESGLTGFGHEYKA